MDEFVSTVPTKTPKCIVSKGKSSVNKTVSEDGQTITFVCCISASGNFIPSTAIFSQNWIKAYLLDGSLPCSGCCGV